MKLILLRHAKAEPHTGDAGDIARRLVPEGRRRAWATAQALARLGLRPDVALVSPSVRTRETWVEMAPALGGQARVIDALYHAAPETIMACVADAAKPDIGVIVVGHNPGMHALAAALADAGRAPRAVRAVLQSGFPTASAAVFDWSQRTDQPEFLALIVKGRTWSAE